MTQVLWVVQGVLVLLFLFAGAWSWCRTASLPNTRRVRRPATMLSVTMSLLPEDAVQSSVNEVEERNSVWPITES